MSNRLLSHCCARLAPHGNATERYDSPSCIWKVWMCCRTTSEVVLSICSVRLIRMWHKRRGEIKYWNFLGDSLCKALWSPSVLVQALDEDQDGPNVVLKKLFEEDREFNQGKLEHAARMQHEDQICMHVSIPAVRRQSLMLRPGKTTEFPSWIRLACLPSHRGLCGGSARPVCDREAGALRGAGAEAA